MAKKKDTEETAIVVGKLDGIVETKLSKSEAINLIIDDIEVKCRERITAIEGEVRELYASLPKEKLRKFVNERSEPRVSFGYGYYSTRVTISNHTEVMKDDLPDWLAAAHERYIKLEKEKEHLGKVLSAMQEKDKARNYILRHSLQSSDEGRDLLKVIETFSVGLQSQLLLAAGEK